MQSRYISKLMQLAEKDERVLHLIADSGTGYDEMFRHNFPNQIFNFGIAEENMVAAAAGLAATGFIPFVCTGGAFLAYRALEFIRDDICFQNLNVKIIGTGCGLSWSSLGPTHHTTEEIGVLRAIPGIRILSPASPIEAGACLQLAYNFTGPVYIRMGINHEKEYFKEDHIVDFGKNETLSMGKDVMILSTGSILEEAIKSSEILNAEGVSAGVVNVVSLKPFDVDSIVELSTKTKYLVTVEEHNIIGGLASIVADVLVDKRISMPIIRIGLCDEFASGFGTVPNIRAENKLDGESIANRIMGDLR